MAPRYRDSVGREVHILCGAGGHGEEKAEAWSFLFIQCLLSGTLAFMHYTVASGVMQPYRKWLMYLHQYACKAFMEVR